MKSAPPAPKSFGRRFIFGAGLACGLSIGLAAHFMSHGSPLLPRKPAINVSSSGSVSARYRGELYVKHGIHWWRALSNDGELEKLEFSGGVGEVLRDAEEKATAEKAWGKLTR